MELALTFGSLGDIIAVWQLAIQLRRALGQGCDAIGSSSKEYQELRQDLDLFVQILLQVVSTYQQRENSIYLGELDRITKAVVQECASSIDAALQRFGGRYHENLQTGGSGSKLRDGYKKLEWAFREKERLQDLREKLQRNIQRLSLLVGLTAQKSNRVDNATLLARIDGIQRLVAAEAESKENLLQMLKDQCRSSKKQEEALNAVENQLAITSGCVWEVLASAKKTLAVVVEMRDIIASLARFAMNCQVLASNAAFLRPIDPTKELPVTLEDSLGRLLTIPPEWVERLQWKTLNSLLEDQFVGQKGHEMVCRRQYALEENCSGKDIERQIPISQSLRRGMRVNMSMVFQLNILSGTCPRCNVDSQAPKGLTITCKTQGCGMRFRLAEATAAGLGSANALAIPGDTPSVRIVSDMEESHPSPHTFKPKPTEAVLTMIHPADFTSVRLLPMRNREPIIGHPDLSHPSDRVVKMQFLPSGEPMPPGAELATSVLLSERFPASFISPQFAKFMQFPAHEAQPPEIVTVPTPCGLSICIRSVLMTLKKESLDPDYSTLRAWIYDDIYAFPPGVSVILGRPDIEHIRSRSKTATVPLQSPQSFVFRCCQCKELIKNYSTCLGIGPNNGICGHDKCSACWESED